MPSTYSINVGTLIEATRKPDIFRVLQDLPDNTQKMISPKDVRDAFLSTWANSSFKITTPSLLSTEYIGIDSGNPSDRDIKQKLLLGKRSYGNLDIMNNSLLSSNSTDIFFYNTKSDSLDQSSTKISILSGTDSNLHFNAPYIQSFATGSTIDLNINNPSLFGGSINIISTAGRVAINGVVFPTVAETVSGAQNGRILKYAGTYPNGFLTWADATLVLTSIGSPTMSTDLWGSPININGFPIEFADDDIIPYSVGGLTAGMSFPSGGFYNPVTATNSDWPVSEIVRRILYPYIPPILELSVKALDGGKLIEAGVSFSLAFTYSITSYARNSDEWVRDFLIKKSNQTANPFIFYGSSFSGGPGSAVSGQFQYITSSSAGVLTYSIEASTSSSPFATSSAYPFRYNLKTEDSIKVVNPVFFGFSSQAPAISGTALASVSQISSSLKKYIVDYPGVSSSINVGATGNGYVYFLYPSSFGTNPVKVIDPNGFIIHDISTVMSWEYYNYEFFHVSQILTPPVNLFSNTVNSINTSSDGKIYCVGSFTSYGGNSSLYISKLNKNGIIDSNFSIGTSFNGIPTQISLQSDDKLIVTGNFTRYNGATAHGIVRLTSTGSYDSSFNTAGSLSTPSLPNFLISGKNLIVQSDDKILIVGLTAYNGSSINNIIRLNSNGTVDVSLSTGSGFDGIATCIERQSDGDYLVGGANTTLGGFTDYNGDTVNSTPNSCSIVRIKSNGDYDDSFNISLSGFVATSAKGALSNRINVIRVQSDGKILVGGTFQYFGPIQPGQVNQRSAICRLNSDGTLDTTFTVTGPNGPGTLLFTNSTVNDILIQPDGKIILTGDFAIGISFFIQPTIRGIIRLNSNGTLDTTFNAVSGLNTYLHGGSASFGGGSGFSLKQESDGKILLGGNFTAYGTASTANPLYTRQRIARLSSDGVLYKPNISTFFGATTSHWYAGNDISGSPYSGNYKVLVSYLPVNYTTTGNFQFIF